jgi:hypothetical protein
VLDLSYTPLTDAGVRELKSLKNLQKVNLSGTPVTKEGLQELRDALPKCTVTW